MTDASGQQQQRASLSHTPVGKRVSLGAKHSTGSGEHRNGSFSASGKAGVKALLSTPVTQASKTRIGGQLFLCIIGTVIGVAIAVWLAFISNEEKKRRLALAGAASFCSLIFVMLGIKTLRAEPPEPELLPDISQERRRSTITGRQPLAKKSTAAVTHGDDGPNEVLVVGDATRPLVTHH